MGMQRSGDPGRYLRHEIRNRLHALRLVLGLLDELGPNEDAVDWLDCVVREADELGMLVERYEVTVGDFAETA
jgi:nitrogen-specific signal transduction histidine kinase